MCHSRVDYTDSFSTFFRNQYTHLSRQNLNFEGFFLISLGWKFFRFLYQFPIIDLQEAMENFVFPWKLMDQGPKNREPLGVICVLLITFKN